MFSLVWENDDDWATRWWKIRWWDTAYKCFRRGNRRGEYENDHGIALACYTLHIRFATGSRKCAAIRAL